jgi:hypothetical protein
MAKEKFTEPKIKGKVKRDGKVYKAKYEDSDRKIKTKDVASSAKTNKTGTVNTKQTIKYKNAEKGDIKKTKYNDKRDGKTPTMKIKVKGGKNRTLKTDADYKKEYGASAKFPEIKKENQGKFTAWVEKNMGGMDTCKAASKVMRSRTKKYSPDVIKMANYANNFGCKTKKEDGASIKKPRGTKQEKDEEKFLKKGGKAVRKRDNKVRRLENKVGKNNITEALMQEKKEKAINKAAGKISKASDKHLKPYVKK